MLGCLFDGSGRVFDAYFVPLLYLNLSNEVEVVPEPYPTAEGKPLTRSQARSMMRNRPLGWPDLHGLTEGVDELMQEHEEHEEEHQEHKNTHDTRTVSLTGQSNRPNRIHTKVGDRQVDTRRDLGWLFLQRPTKPLQ